MSLEEPKFVTFIEGVFKKHGSDYHKIKDKFYELFNDNPAKRDRLAVFSHFYYFICDPDNTKKDATREELQIIGITSLIEAMMEDVEYKGVFEYFESTFSGENSIADFSKFKNDYLEKYGATKKIVSYFNDYIPKDQAEVIIKKIKRYSNQYRTHEPMASVQELAKFLYQMRSDFVHRAEMVCLCPPGVSGAFMGIGDKHYYLTVGIAEIFNIFEKSFVKYWDNKFEAIKSN